MTKKNKIVLIAAIAAVALLIGSGIARCAFSGAPTDEGQDASGQSAPQADTDGDISQTNANKDTNLESLAGSSWVSVDDAKLTMQVLSGAFVETKDNKTAVTYFDVESESVSGDTLTAHVLTSKSANDEQKATVVKVVSNDTEDTLTCDVLQAKYKRAETEAQELEFSGVTDKLSESMGAELADIERAVSARAAKVSPKAKTATWTGEVWCDFRNDTATTTFALDDGAATNISVTRSSGGKIEAL